MPIIIRFINWLRLNSVLNIGIAIIYYLMVVLPHNEIGQFLGKTLDEPLGRNQYNQLILGLGLLVGIIYLLINFAGLRKFPQRRTISLIYIGITFSLITIAINYLMVVNIEMVHLVQYAVLAILLFPLCTSFRQTLFFTIFLGILDEAYQFWVLFPTTDYFDFNDVVINILGAGLGLVLLYTIGEESRKRIQKINKTPQIVLSFLFVAILIGFYHTNILNIYPNTQIIPSPLTLIRNPNLTFWTEGPLAVTFHILQPLSGVFIGLLLFIFYQRLDNFRTTRDSKYKLQIFSTI